MPACRQVLRVHKNHDKAYNVILLATRMVGWAKVDSCRRGDSFDLRRICGFPLVRFYTDAQVAFIIIVNYSLAWIPKLHVSITHTTHYTKCLWQVDKVFCHPSIAFTTVEGQTSSLCKLDIMDGDTLFIILAIIIAVLVEFATQYW